MKLPFEIGMFFPALSAPTQHDEDNDAAFFPSLSLKSTSFHFGDLTLVPLNRNIMSFVQNGQQG